MFLLLGLMVRMPTYKYFVIPDGYTEIEINDPKVQSAFEYGKDLVPKFLSCFSGPHPIVMTHAWTKTTEKSVFYAVEVLRQRQRYVITVRVTNGVQTLHSVRILNEEGAGGDHWFRPEQKIVDLVMDGVKAKYPGSELRNVAVYHTQMAGKTTGQMVVDVTNGDAAHLVDVEIVKGFGEKEFKVVEVKEIY